jgi:hypothetical protein
MKRASILVGALVLLALAVAAAPTQAQALYGATASGALGRLYVLDPATGAVLQDVGPLNDAVGTNYPITGLASHPITGALYGSTGNNPVATSATFVSIDPATALVTVIGQFDAGPTNSSGVESTMGDLAFDAAGNLFGIGTLGGPQLYSINILTGKATVIGNSQLTSTTGGGLAISPVSGIAYGTPTASRYGTYDLITGIYTDITNPAKPGGGGAYAALDFNGSLLYGLNSAPGSPPPTFLVTIDPTTGTVTNLGQSVNSLDAIAFVIPEPSAAVILLLTLIATATTRRR